ncbi:MAG: ABC transporter substrate-binding protein [Actinomycetota bacterium]|nr:ABC transporter substrate-binding protein [Actinomycetota bacterium]
MEGKMRRGISRILALLLVFAMIAASCGSDDDGSSGSDSSGTSDTASSASSSDSDEAAEEEEEVTGSLSQEDVEEAIEADDEEEAEEPEVTFDRSTIEGIWEEAAYNRQQMVDKITAKMDAGEWGIGDDNVLRGPAGFEIDLNDCPDDWSNTHGITSNQIRIGHTTVMSGNLAAYGSLATGWESLLRYTNDTGGVDGKDVELIIKDDGYVAAQTIEFVDELIESSNVFAILTLGSPNTLAVYDKINEECIPHPFVMTGHPAWGDPEIHPWTTGLHMSYSTEAVLWGTWIKNNLADKLPVKVAGLVMDNDFGLAYEIGFELYAHANPDVVSEYLPVRHDPAAPTLTNEVTTIAAFDPDVFISMTAGNPCLLAIQEVEASGLLARLDAAFTPSVCKAIAAYMKPAGMAADKWYVVGGGNKDSTDPKYADEPFISFINSTLTDHGLDPNISLYAAGYSYGYPHTEMLRVAAELPGGLTRTNFILAVRNIAIYHPQIMDGITTGLNGAADGYFVEGSDFSQFDATEQTWNQVGDILDLDGGTPNCKWDKDNGGCR